MIEFDYRFGGIQRLYGLEGFTKIQNSHVCVVGLGGVGSWAVESLARTGVGKLTLVDFDEICVSNTNRQLPALQGHVGQLKSQVLKERVLQINPEIEVVIKDLAFSRETEVEVFTESFDVVIDAIDHGLTKLHLVLACRERQTPVVVAGSAGGRWNPSLIETSDLSKTHEDAMLSILRKDLRRQAGYPRKGPMGIACVYSTEKVTYSDAQGCLSQDKPQDFKKPLDCSTGLGTVTHITGTFGFCLSHLAIQEILQK